MFQVFLSYAREDRERARTVAAALESQGWPVWWDRQIIPGQSFDQTIDQQLQDAGAVVVLWSPASVNSEWVRNEAAAGVEHNALVPAVIEQVTLPLEFRRRHAADLTAWNGDVRDEEFQALLHGLAAKREARRLAPASPGSAVDRVPDSGRSVPAAIRRDGPSPGEGASRVRRYAIAAALAGLVLAGWLTSRVWAPSGAGGALPTSDIHAPTAGPEPVGAPDRPASWRSLDVSSIRERSAEEPVPLPLDTIAKVRLQRDETVYFRLPTAARAFTVVVDIRLVENATINLQGSLAVTDESGGSVRDSLVSFNDVRRSGRATATYTADKAARFGFKLTNGLNPADVWLTVRPGGSPDLVPFFGDKVPHPLRLAEVYRGRLGLNELACYRTLLPFGVYDAVLGLVRVDGGRNNIGGFLTKYGVEGGNGTTLIFINEVDVSYRRTAGFTLSEVGPAIFCVENVHDIVDYTLSVKPHDVAGR